MKKLVLITSLIVSTFATAGELTVLDMPSKMAFGEMHSRFEVNLNDDTAGVSVTFRKRGYGRRHHITQVRKYEQLVPELALVDNVLTLDVNGEPVTCGTMGVTRIFKVPVLNLNGNCVLEKRRVKTSEGKRFQLIIKY